MCFYLLFNSFLLHFLYDFCDIKFINSFFFYISFTFDIDIEKKKARFHGCVSFLFSKTFNVENIKLNC